MSIGSAKCYVSWKNRKISFLILRRVSSQCIVIFAILPKYKYLSRLNKEDCAIRYSVLRYTRVYSTLLCSAQIQSLLRPQTRYTTCVVDCYRSDTDTFEETSVANKIYISVTNVSDCVSDARPSVKWNYSMRRRSDLFFFFFLHALILSPISLSRTASLCLNRRSRVVLFRAYN